MATVLVALAFVTAPSSLARLFGFAARAAGYGIASNALFGGLQKITARQIGPSPASMAASNSSSGVTGKAIDAQSTVVAPTATN